MVCHCLSVAIILLCCCSGLTVADKYYVTPSLYTSCPEKNLPCMTLSEYATKPNSYFSANTTLILLPGNHTLDQNFTLFDLNYVALLFDSTAQLLKVSHRERVTCSIFCVNRASLQFFNIDVVYLEGLNIVGCSQNEIVLVKKFTLLKSRIKGQNNSGSALEISGVGEAEIIESEFVSNTEGTSVPIPHTNQTVKRGGAVSIRHSQVTIKNSTFLKNSVLTSTDLVKFDSRGTEYLSLGGALYLQQSVIQIVGSIFTSNTASDEGGAIFAISCCIAVFNSRMRYNKAYRGGVFHVIDSNVSVHGSELSHNLDSTQGGVLCVTTLFTNSSLAKFNNCTFKDNRAVFGGSIAAFSHSHLVINSSKFYHNTANSSGGSIYAEQLCTLDIRLSSFVNNIADYSAGVIAALDHTKVTIRDSHFQDNTVSEVSAGVIYANTSDISIGSSVFIGNKANLSGGVVYASPVISLELHNSSFVNNTAIYGGVMWVANGTRVTVCDCQFHKNKAVGPTRKDPTFTGKSGGNQFTDKVSDMDDLCQLNNNNESIAVGNAGVVSTWNSTISIERSNFTENTASNCGGVAYFDAGTNAILDSSTFEHNHINCSGGVFYMFMSSILIKGCSFRHNTALRGGVLESGNAFTTIVNSTMSYNTAYFYGGAIQCAGEQTKFGPSKINLLNTTFSHNLGVRTGGAIVLYVCNFTSGDSLHIQYNTGGISAVFIIQSVVTFGGSTSVTNNFGSVYAIDSSITVKGNATFTNNSPYNGSSHYNHIEKSLYQEAGALTIFRGELTLKRGIFTFKNNCAESGGAFLAIQSTINVYSSAVTIIADNVATSAGGGIYVYQSVLSIGGKCNITNNTAIDSGGGIHAASATVEFSNGSFSVNNNHAGRGGGIFLELSSKVFVLKYALEAYDCNQPTICIDPSKWTTVRYTGNSADMYGGAIFVKDSSNSDTCTNTIHTTPNSVPTKECFYQNIAIDYNSFLTTEATHVNNTHFSNNSAIIAGDTLYGGLLDRCIVSPFAEHFKNTTWYTPVFYFENITNVEQHSISSEPVRVCFCRDQEHNCSYQHPTVKVFKGQTFNVSVVSVDQVNHTTPSTVTCSLSSQSGGLSEGESRQNTTRKCTILQYTLVSPSASEQLNFHAKGPCKDIGMSKVSLNVEFLPCPIGFSLTRSNSSCDCDPALKPYINNCSLQTSSLIRNRDFWIDFVEGDYLIYPHCPFDYCYPPIKMVSVNLNVRNGSDSQCAYNRAGKLCGKCKPGFSLTLGSTHCKVCSSSWISLVLPFTLAGIVLVAFLLMLNLTVAIGTIGGIVFYANIIAANYSIFFSFEKPTFLSVFIAWLNLDFGFETCLYDGMDAYVKTWLQFVFPLYIIILVAAIIVISDYSPRFASLFTGKNPVATLATLILLSYTKLLRTIIASLSFAELNYRNGIVDSEMVWLLDANVPYLRGKHIPLFIAAVVTALVGLLYTLVLFSWQWLVLCPRNPTLTRILLKLITLSKLLAFVDAYHAPHNKDLRYWAGMLLLLRTLLYLISAVNVLGDPRVNLVSIICATAFIFVIQALVREKPLKRTFCNVLEIANHFNLFVLSALTFYFKDSQGNQTVLEYISVSITFTLFCIVVLYHVFTFTLASASNLETLRNMLRTIVQARQNDQMRDLPNVISLSSDLYEAPSVTEIDGRPSIHSTTQDTNSTTYERSESYLPTVETESLVSGDEESSVSADDDVDETQPLLSNVSDSQN